jgi:hypothetical protein
MSLDDRKVLPEGQDAVLWQTSYMVLYAYPEGHSSVAGASQNPVVTFMVPEGHVAD